MMIRLTVVQAAKIAAVAARFKLSRAELVRRCISTIDPARFGPYATPAGVLESLERIYVPPLAH